MPLNEISIDMWLLVPLPVLPSPAVKVVVQTHRQPGKGAKHREAVEGTVRGRRRSASMRTVQLSRRVWRWKLSGQKEVS